MSIFKGAMPRLALWSGLFGVVAAQAQLVHNCPPVSPTEFKMTTLVDRPMGIEEPIKMALDMDAAGNVDIYFVERQGKVKKFTGATKTLATIGTVNIFVGYEDGLTGIVLDPAFKTNHNMFLYYSQGTKDVFHFRVARFTLNAQGMLDMATEKPILEIPAIASHMHTGGAMQFDGAGDLWITTGENQSGEEGPPNTNDLRGKILRIHPTPDGAYTVPAGNLFPPGTAKTRPEIYIMGCRNPYSIALDPARHAVAWGDIGPDGQGQTEEHDFAVAPGNFGYPYFAGNNITLSGTAPASAPVNNNSKNTGLNNLPPAQPAMDPYQQLAAITGPIYRYNGSLQSNVKFPPHFDGLWFVADFQNNEMDTISLNKAGTAMIAKAKVFPTLKITNLLDMKTGPDGALYILNYAGFFTASAQTGIVRIDYTGSCRPDIATAIAAPEKSMVQARGMMVEVEASQGRHELAIGNLQGRTLATFKGEGAMAYDVAGAVGNHPGLYIAKLTTAAGVFSRTLILGGR
ncbi:MAG: secreted glycosyl hydrolase [Fibrobacteres bacterium]|nr:secreted glycosyl hydrolase [Fibrobacterota bacterium]